MKDCYARWVLNHMRFPAALQADFEPFMKDNKLFCTFQDKRYQVVFTSRVGWIRLESKNERHDVWVDDCSNWSNKLEL